MEKIKNLDFYGLKPELYVNGKRAHQTYFGVFLLFVTIGLDIFFFIYLFRNFSRKFLQIPIQQIGA